MKPGPVRQRSARRSRAGSSVQAILTGVLTLVVAQLLLLTMAVEGFLGGRQRGLLAAAMVSAWCCVGACGLVRRLGPRRRD